MNLWRHAGVGDAQGVENLDDAVLVRARAAVVASGGSVMTWLRARPPHVTKGCQIEQFAHAVMPLTFAELVAVTGGQSAEVVSRTQTTAAQRVRRHKSGVSDVKSERVRARRLLGVMPRSRL